MKKPARSKKPAVRKPPKAPGQTAHAAHLSKPAKNQATKHAASDIGPITALLLGLPQPAKTRSPQRASARTNAAAALHPGDTSAFLLLSLPILAMILSLGITQSLKPLRRTELTAAPASLIPPSTTGMPNTITAPAASVRLTATTPPLSLPVTAPSLTATAPTVATLSAPSVATLPARTSTALNQSLPGQLVAPYEPALSSPSPARTAMLNTAPPPTIAPPAALQPPLLGDTQFPEFAARDADLNTGPAVCTAPGHLLTRARPALRYDPAIAALTPAAYGQALATAAQTQTKDFVIYNDKYRSISYPNGDVQPLYGVCTDVIIRAYRTLGVDLQQLVHEARIGSGDVSIDHRRTEVLRRFFASFGEQLPASTYGEDYLPGDIVTYNRPQNRHSRSHIAMVSGVTGPSGRYMIVHNRGWGPQLEDGLFVDEITGHYRYRAIPTPPAAAIASASASAITSTRPARPSIAAPAPQKRPVAVTRIAARDARVSSLRRKESARDGASVPGLGR